MCSRKRGTQEMEVDEVPREQDLLDQLRNMWEFANLSQWIYLFGRAVKISEDVNIEVRETYQDRDDCCITDIVMTVVY